MISETSTVMVVEVEVVVVAAAAAGLVVVVVVVLVVVVVVLVVVVVVAEAVAVLVVVAVVAAAVAVVALVVVVAVVLAVIAVAVVVVVVVLVLVLVLVLVVVVVVVVVVAVVVVVVSTPAQLCPSSGTHIYGGGSIYAMEQTLRWSLAPKRDDHIPRAASHASALASWEPPGPNKGRTGLTNACAPSIPWPANASVSVPDSHTSTDSCDQRTATSAFVPLSVGTGRRPRCKRMSTSSQELAQLSPQLAQARHGYHPHSSWVRAVRPPH